MAEVINAVMVKGIPDKTPAYQFVTKRTIIGSNHAYLKTSLISLIMEDVEIDLFSYIKNVYMAVGRQKIKN